MKLRRIVVDRFRHVKPGTTVDFSAGVNVIVGRNGSGKTSLLEIASMLAARDFSPLANEPFSFRFELGADDTIFSLNVRNEELYGGSPESRRLLWSYEIEPAEKQWSLMAASGKPTTYVGPSGTTDLPTFSPFQRCFWGESLVPVLKSDRTTTDVWAAGVGVEPTRFDEQLGAYTRLTGGRGFGSTSWGLEGAPVVYHGLVADGMVVGVGEGLGGPSTGLLEALKQPLAPTLSIDDSKLPSLHAIRAALGFDAARLTLMQLERRGRSGPFAESVLLGKVSVLFTAGDRSFTDEILSFGQKRLMSFLFHADSAQDLVIADELANGLHYDWIRVCLDAIGDKQALLATQNPLLLDHLPITDAESVRKALILCDEQGGALVWRNLTAEEAADFFGAWEVGIQHVSEILRSKGLW